MDALLEKLKFGIFDVEVQYDDGSVAWFKCTANPTVLKNRGLEDNSIYNLNRNRRLFDDEIKGLKILNDEETGEHSSLDVYLNKGI